MSNPAQLLYDLFLRWDTHGQEAPSTKRESLPEHRAAFRYLDQIESVLDVMESRGERVAAFRSRFPEWVRMVANWNQPWSTRTAGFDDGALQVLDTLIDHVGRLSPEVEDERRASLSQTIDLILSDLAVDETLPTELKAHLFIAAEHASRCVREYETLGSFELAQAVDRLTAELLRAGVAEVEANVDDTTWRDRFRTFVREWSVQSTIAITSGAATPAVLALLGAG